MDRFWPASALAFTDPRFDPRDRRELGKNLEQPRRDAGPSPGEDAREGPQDVDLKGMDNGTGYSLPLSIVKDSMYRGKSRRKVLG